MELASKGINGNAHMSFYHVILRFDIEMAAYESILLSSMRHMQPPWGKSVSFFGYYSVVLTAR